MTIKKYITLIISSLCVIGLGLWYAYTHDMFLKSSIIVSGALAVLLAVSVGMAKIAAFKGLTNLSDKFGRFFMGVCIAMMISCGIYNNNGYMPRSYLAIPITFLLEGTFTFFLRGPNTITRKVY